MSLTELFFRLALGVSFTFSICFVILFVAYKIIIIELTKILRR